MKDNSMLVNSKEAESVKIDYVNVMNQVSFENLGFKFETKNNHSYAILPKGWKIEEYLDGFTLNFVDGDSIDHGKIEFGNYPHRKGCMWLYDEITK